MAGRVLAYELKKIKTYISNRMIINLYNEIEARNIEKSQFTAKTVKKLRLRIKLVLARKSKISTVFCFTF